MRFVQTCHKLQYDIVQSHNMTRGAKRGLLHKKEVLTLHFQYKKTANSLNIQWFKHFRICEE